MVDKPRKGSKENPYTVKEFQQKTAKEKALHPGKTRVAIRREQAATGRTFVKAPVTSFRKITDPKSGKVKEITVFGGTEVKLTETGKKPVTFFSGKNFEGKAHARFLDISSRGIKPQDLRKTDTVKVVKQIKPEPKISLFGKTPLPRSADKPGLFNLTAEKKEDKANFSKFKEVKSFFAAPVLKKEPSLTAKADLGKFGQDILKADFKRQKIKEKFDKFKEKFKAISGLTTEENDKWIKKVDKAIGRGVVDVAALPVELANLGSQLVGSINGAINLATLNKKDQKAVKKELKLMHKEGVKAASGVFVDTAVSAKRAVVNGDPEAIADMVILLSFGAVARMKILKARAVKVARAAEKAAKVAKLAEKTVKVDKASLKKEAIRQGQGTLDPFIRDANAVKKQKMKLLDKAIKKEIELTKKIYGKESAELKGKAKRELKQLKKKEGKSKEFKKGIAERLIEEKQALINEKANKITLKKIKDKIKGDAQLGIEKSREIFDKKFKEQNAEIKKGKAQAKQSKIDKLSNRRNRAMSEFDRFDLNRREFFKSERAKKLLFESKAEILDKLKNTKNQGQIDKILKDVIDKADKGLAKDFKTPESRKVLSVLGEDVKGNKKILKDLNKPKKSVGDKPEMVAKQVGDQILLIEKPKLPKVEKPDLKSKTSTKPDKPKTSQKAKSDEGLPSDKFKTKPKDGKPGKGKGTFLSKLEESSGTKAGTKPTPKTSTSEGVVPDVAERIKDKVTGKQDQKAGQIKSLKIIPISATAVGVALTQKITPDSIPVQVTDTQLIPFDPVPPTGGGKKKKGKPPFGFRLKDELIRLAKKSKKSRGIIDFQFQPTLSGLGQKAGPPLKFYTGFEKRSGKITLNKPITVHKHKRSNLKNKLFVRKHGRNRAKFKGFSARNKK